MDNSPIIHTGDPFNYHPSTKLGEGNAFTGVCKSFCLQRQWVSLVPCPLLVGISGPNSFGYLWHQVPSGSGISGTWRWACPRGWWVCPGGLGTKPPIHVSRDCPFNLCVPVVLWRPYGLSYARPWHGCNTQDRHHRLQMQTAVARAMTQTASLKLQQMSHAPYCRSMTSSAGPLKYGPQPVFKVFWPVTVLLYGPSQIVPCSSLLDPFREPPLILL